MHVNEPIIGRRNAAEIIYIGAIIGRDLQVAQGGLGGGGQAEQRYFGWAGSDSIVIITSRSAGQARNKRALIPTASQFRLFSRYAYDARANLFAMNKWLQIIDENE